MIPRKIYVASSWCNENYMEVVARLREAGHDVYDFRNPPSGDPGFKWNDVFKDYGFEDASLFRYKETQDGNETEKDLTFPDFYDEDGEKVNTERLTDFVKKVMNWKKTSEENN